MLYNKKSNDIINANHSVSVTRIAMAEEICRKYRREGRFFDEILKEGN